MTKTQQRKPVSFFIDAEKTLDNLNWVFLFVTKEKLNLRDGNKYAL